MTETITNRHGDEIRIGQLWTDDLRRTSRRTLRVDGFESAGQLGARVVCTVIRSHDTDTGQVTEPGRVAGDQGRQSAHHRRWSGLPPHCRGRSASLAVMSGFSTIMTAAKEAPVPQQNTSPRAWAEAVLAEGVACIVDVETTGFEGSIVEIAAIDAATGAVLLDTLVDCGPVEIEPGAHAVHGITAANLIGAPRWPEVFAQLTAVTAGRLILAYNAPFDRDRVLDDCHRAGLDPAHLAEPGRWQCVMVRRCTALGLGLGGRVRLDGGHRALSDVRATRALVMLLAEGRTDAAGLAALVDRTADEARPGDDREHAVTSDVLP